jgi:hypothetical protein
MPSNNYRLNLHVINAKDQSCSNKKLVKIMKLKCILIIWLHSQLKEVD